MYYPFYDFLQLIHGEQITVHMVINIALTVIGLLTAVMNVPRNSTWAEKPAMSRTYNSKCTHPMLISFLIGKHAPLDFYDSTDWWRLSVANSMASTLAVCICIVDNIHKVHCSEA